MLYRRISTLPRSGSLPRTNVPAAVWLFVASCVASVVLLWPLPANLHSVSLDTKDALHQGWTIHWIQRALTTPGTPFWAAPSNYPSTTALAINQPIYTSALLGLPLYLLGWEAHAVFNALVLLSFALACWSMALLGRFLTGSALAGLLAGCMYAFSTVRMAHIVHLNLLSGFWTVLLLLLLLRMWREPPASRRSTLALAFGLGILAAAQILGDVYNAIYMVVALVLLVVYQVVTGRARLPGHIVRALGLAALLGLLLCLPVLLPTLRTWQELGVERNFRDHERYSATPATYLAFVHRSLLGYDLKSVFPGARLSSAAEQALWPGLMTLALAAGGLLFARRAQRQEQGYWVLLACATFFLSLGPTIRLAKGDAGIASLPYRWLYEYAPLFSAARVPTRWWLLGQVALAALAAYGFAALMRYALRARSGFPRAVVAALPLGIAALVVADSWPASVNGTTALTGSRFPEAYRTLAALPPGALLEWPMESRDEFINHRYEHFTMYHGHAIVNSASSIVPARYLELRDFLRRFPNAESIIMLRDLGVRYINVHHWGITNWEELEPRLREARGLRLLREFPRNSLYEVLPGQPPLPAPAAAILTSGATPRLAVDVSAPLWLDQPATYYRPDRPTDVRLAHRDGSVKQYTLPLPPVLLPGHYEWPLPGAPSDVTTVSLAGNELALVPSPTTLAGRLAAGPQLVASMPSGETLAGSTLICQVYGKGPIDRQGLILSVNLVDEQFRNYAKHDIFFDATTTPPDKWNATSFTRAPCSLDLPADLRPGTYYLAIGLFDPAAQQFVPIADANGAPVETAWRVPQPIVVK